jgi:ribosomal protein S27AE
MAFGALQYISIFAYLFNDSDPIELVVFGFAGSIIGAVWFLFGWYGGIPLVNTIKDWKQSEDLTNVSTSDIAGLGVIKRRLWTIVLGIPIVIAPLVIILSIFGASSSPNLIIIIPSVITAFFIFSVIVGRAFASRCPRCGYGFFASSKKRGATFKWRKSCGVCGLALFF